MASRACENSGAVVVASALLDAVDRLQIRSLSRRPSGPEPADVRGAEAADVPTAESGVEHWAQSGAEHGALSGDESDGSGSSADPTGTLLVGDQWTALLAAGQALLHVPGGANDPRARPAVEARALLALPGGAPVALVPLSAGRRALGLIIAAWPEGDELAAQDALPALAAFAIQVAVALTASRAHDDRARLALLEDRDRIARDMHDNVVQRLFSTGLSLQSAAPLAQHPVVRTRLNQAVSDLDSAIREIRQAIFALHTVDPVPRLVATLESIARSCAVSLGFTPQVAVEGRPDLAAAVSSQLTDGWSTGSLADSVSDSVSEAIWASLRADILAVVREGLANIARHAGASAARVLVVMGGFIDIYVTDNGSGTDPGAARSGLVNLRKRAEARGGVLEVLTAEGGGTVLHWRVPVASEGPDPHGTGRR
jgi:signal transduction histidine kinase